MRGQLHGPNDGPRKDPQTLTGFERSRTTGKYVVQKVNVQPTATALPPSVPRPDASATTNTSLPRPNARIAEIPGKATASAASAKEPSNDSLGAPVGVYGPRLKRRCMEDVCYGSGMTHREIKRLIALFDDIDTTHSGVINLVEFYYLLESPQNEYTRGILRLAPQRSDPKKLSLDDFVEIVVKFACMDNEGVIEFCFETFDEDESGALDSNEFRNLCSAIQVRTDTFFNGNFMRAMEHFDEDKDEQLNRREFRLLSIQFGLIFYPIFRFQNKVRVKTLGRWKWYHIKRRGKSIDACRHYMQTHDGREPPITWFDRVFSCWTHAPRLRHIAIQLYKADQHRLQLEAQRAAILFNLGVLPKGATHEPSKPIPFEVKSSG